MPVGFQNFEFSYLNKKKKPVFVPSEKGREIGDEVRTLIEEAVDFPENYYHFARGGHVAALHRHRENPFFARIDIQNFFYSISRNRAARVLREVGIPKAGHFAKWSSVRNPYDQPRYAIPYGFVQSPILATLVLMKSEIGARISNLPPEVFCSVYLDDIAISSADDALLKASFDDLLVACAASNLPLNTAKTAEPNASMTLFNCTVTEGVTAVTQERRDEFFDGPRTTASVNAFEVYCDKVQRGNIA